MKFFEYDLVNYNVDLLNCNTYFLNTPSFIINHYICLRIEDKYTDIYTFDNVALDYWHCAEIESFDEQKILTILKGNIGQSYKAEFDKLFGKYYIWL